jgi:hypothetical protein
MRYGLATTFVWIGALKFGPAQLVTGLDAQQRSVTAIALVRCDLLSGVSHSALPEGMRSAPS